MKRPQVTFHVTVHPVFYVHSCAIEREQRARGLFGFHGWRACPDCASEPHGFEVWGSNGHCQASPPSREVLIHWLRLKARAQWPTRDGETMGYTFSAGGPLYYQAPEVSR